MTEAVVETISRHTHLYTPFDVYPDFTIADHARGVTFYWEHLSLLDDPGYRVRWERKREEYRKASILPWEKGGGEQGTLIETRDDPGGALDAERIARLIDEVVLG